MTIQDQISRHAEKIFIYDRLVFQNCIEIENGIRLYYMEEEMQDQDDDTFEYIKTQEPTDTYLDIATNGTFKLRVENEWYDFSLIFNISPINEIIKIIKEDK